MLELANERDDVYLFTPLYHILYGAVGTHLGGIGYRLVGEYIGYVLKEFATDGVVPKHLKPLSATRKGNTVRVRFDVPTYPMVLETTQLGVTQNIGFPLTSDSGDATIGSVFVENGDTAVIAFSGSLGANPAIRYTMDSSSPL